MTWLWSSFEEFKKYNYPITRVGRHGPFRESEISSQFENLWVLFKEFENLYEATTKLRKMGYAEDPPLQNNKDLKTAQFLTWEIAFSGEMLLLYHKRLAKSHWARDFRKEKDLQEHWKRYVSSERIFHELRNLILATEKLCDGFNQIQTEDDGFLIEELELPPHLMEDFEQARNLFSVGFDSAGVFLAGRGLEGVLRELVGKRKIQISIPKKKKTRPVSEADFYDLIQALHHMRWKKDDIPVIDKETMGLLNFLRTMRNSGAHPTKSKKKLNRTWRELAVVITQTADSLWNDTRWKRAKLTSNVIEKDW